MKEKTKTNHNKLTESHFGRYRQRRREKRQGRREDESHPVRLDFRCLCKAVGIRGISEMGKADCEVSPVW